MAFADAQAGGLILEGSLPAEITLAGTVVKGDAIGYSTGWKRALATVGSVIQQRAVAAMDGKTGDKIVAYFGKTRIGGRVSGATIGNPVYVAEGTDNGKYTDTAPSTQNDANKVVGYAVAATEIVVDPIGNPDSLAA